MTFSGSNPDRTNPRDLIRSYLVQGLPASALAAIETYSSSETGDDLVLMRASALIDQDRYIEAEKFLSRNLGLINSDHRPGGLCLWSQVALKMGRVDEATLTALQAVQESQNQPERAEALSWVAAGYSRKYCWNSAESAIREALALSPSSSRILAVQAKIRLDADQRIGSRAIYERLQTHTDLWGKIIGTWGVSYIAYLMGEFELAWETGQIGLSLSPEAVYPAYILLQISLARNDLENAETMLDQLQHRNPNTDRLSSFHREVDQLRARFSTNESERKRLVAFPTLVQRRDYCGPSTIELVLRYWENRPKINNDLIADWVKVPHSGSPMYKMREFFQLLGYETIRSLLPAQKLKQLIDLGIPVIIQEEFSYTSHVVVVIGYDNSNRTFELQDPMTHTVVVVSEEELGKLREIYQESGLIAYPRGFGLQQQLSGLNIYDHPTLVWSDQAVIDLEHGRYHDAINLLVQAVKRNPSHQFSWVVLLYACLDLWRDAARGRIYEDAAEKNWVDQNKNVRVARRRFLVHLRNARAAHPAHSFLYPLIGQAAMLEGKYEQALSAFDKAIEHDPQNPRVQAALAECYFAVREPRKAYEACSKCLEIDPAHPAGNVWMARSLVALGRDQALYYAHSGIELAGDWWLAHLALAEALIQNHEYEHAQEAFEKARNLNPEEPDLIIRIAHLSILRGDYQTAQDWIKPLLQQNLTSVEQIYSIRKMLCQIVFEQGNLHQAGREVSALLQSFPNDPWGLQILATVTSDIYLDSGEEIPPEQLESVRDLFEQAVLSNQGNPDVVELYLGYLTEIDGIASSLEALDRFLEIYQDRKAAYFFLKGKLLYQTGLIHQAAEAMMQACEQPNRISSTSDFEEAIRIILQGPNPVDDAAKILEKIQLWNTFPRNEIHRYERSLGLVLATQQETKEMASILLEQASLRDSEDFEVLLRLGELSKSDLVRESNYRRALLLSPNWIEAREVLVEFLYQKGRVDEILELTAGYEQGSEKLEISRARAFFSKGLYESTASRLRKLIKMEPETNSFLLDELWNAEFLSGWYSSAHKLAQQAARFFPEDPMWALRDALTLVEMGKYHQADRVFRKAISLGLVDVDQYRYEYRLFYIQEEFLNALECLEELNLITGQEPGENLSPIDLDIVRVLAIMEDENGILNFVSRRNLTADGWGNAASAVLMGGCLELAVKFAHNSLDMDTNNSIGSMVLGKSLYEMGRIEESMNVFRKIHTQHPNKHQIYEFLALEAIINHQFQEAFELADRAVRLGAYSAEVWAVRGLVCFVLQREKEAREDLHIAWTRLDKINRRKRPIFWAVYFRILGNLDEAIGWWKLAPGNQGDRYLIPVIEPYLNGSIGDDHP